MYTFTKYLQKHRHTYTVFELYVFVHKHEFGCNPSAVQCLRLFCRAKLIAPCCGHSDVCGYCRIQLLTGVHCTADHGSGASPTNIFTFYLLFEELDGGGSTSALRQVALVGSVHCTTDHRSGAFPTCVGDCNLECLPTWNFNFQKYLQGASILTGPKIAPCNH